MRPTLWQAVVQQARSHIELDGPHELHNSALSPSGPHAGTVVAGFCSEAPPAENPVHNLEHSYAIIVYIGGMSGGQFRVFVVEIIE